MEAPVGDDGDRVSLGELRRARVLQPAPPATLPRSERPGEHRRIRVGGDRLLADGGALGRDLQADVVEPDGHQCAVIGRAAVEVEPRELAAQREDAVVRRGQRRDRDLRTPPLVDKGLIEAPELRVIFVEEQDAEVVGGDALLDLRAVVEREHEVLHDGHRPGDAQRAVARACARGEAQAVALAVRAGRDDLRDRVGALQGLVLSELA